MSNSNCQSCGMPIEVGIYCRYCSDEHGKLHSFEESLERMVQFTLRQKPALSRAEAERQTLNHMASMPAWRDHPKVKDGIR